MIDPWRNPPWGNCDWYLYDFPNTEVDIGISTHAHFNHDGLHALSGNMLLDRLAGEFAFADIKVTGITDKLVSDSSHNAYDWAAMTRKLTKMQTDPPNNWRSFDNSLIVVETGGLVSGVGSARRAFEQRALLVRIRSRARNRDIASSRLPAMLPQLPPLPAHHEGPE